MKNKRAFTLIELLVVIAIIGLLATISVIALNDARAKARDAKRAADIQQVQTALELFFNDKNRYPTDSEFYSGSIFSTSTNGTTTYMANIPTAPTPPDGNCNGSNNEYIYSSNSNNYKIQYCTGGVVGSSGAGLKCATPAGLFSGQCFACGDNVYYGGEDYPTVAIGSQCWFAKNLNIGTMVAGGSDQQDYSLGPQKYCYNNNSGQDYCAVYGGLYEWHTMMGFPQVCDNHNNTAPCVNTNPQQGICPAGWHIPGTSDFSDLIAYLGGNSVAGGKLKETGTSHWGAPNTGADNSSGFTALPSGQLSGGSFGFLTDYGMFWSAQIWLDASGFDYFIADSTTAVNSSGNAHTNGYAIRCLQN